jgi:predicted phosphodiesterase
MRLAVFSDIHGNLAAFEAVLNDLRNAGGADKTWILGDLCAFGPRPTECINIIRDMPECSLIGGNTDRYLVTGERHPLPRIKEEAGWQKRVKEVQTRDANLAWTLAQFSFADYEFLAKILRRELDLKIPGYGWAIGYHGTPGNDEGYMFPDTSSEEVVDQFSDREGRLGFGGHTHLPMDRDLGRWRVVNVGSVGLPKDEMRACYALVSFSEGNPAAVEIELRRVEYDYESVVTDLRQQGNPSWEWSAEQIKKPMEKKSE